MSSKQAQYPFTFKDLFSAVGTWLTAIVRKKPNPGNKSE
jgi:hypothetical protein